MSLELFHPVIQQWFRGRFAAPTEPQELGWPELVAGRDVLIAAPTGSGKTLTVFLAAIDRLLRLAVRNELTDEIRVVCVSPLRVLSNGCSFGKAAVGWMSGGNNEPEKAPLWGSEFKWP